MAIKGMVTPRAGRVRHKDPRVSEVRASCPCGTVQTVPVDSTMELAEQVAEESCLFCGLFGRLRVVA